MAARATKKTTITVAGARIGVAVMTAASEHGGMKFHSFHAKDGGEVKRPTLCGKCGDPLAASDIVKRYTFPDGVSVEVDSEDLAFAAGEVAKTFKIDRFIPSSAITPLMAEKSYYLVPTDGGDVAFSSLAASLVSTGSVALCRGSVGSAERVYAISALSGGTMALQQLHYASDLRVPEAKAGIAEPDRVLVEAMSEYILANTGTAADLAGYEDEYAGRLEAVLLLKKHGVLPRTITPAEPEADAGPDSLDRLKELVGGVVSAARGAGNGEAVA